MILKLTEVSKNFESLAALTNVSFNVDSGEILGIAGPNGAGKSTLFNVISGTFPLSSGKIIFNDHDITRLDSHQICNLGIGRTFQTPITFLTMSVYENLFIGATFGGRLKGKAVKNRVDETLEFLNLVDFRDQPADNLDLYTSKLVMLGAVLATGCELLMMDEPLGGLSSPETDQFMGLVHKINKKKGITTIIIEHILDSLFAVADRMVILHNGGVIYNGDPDGIRENEKIKEVYLGKEDDIDEKNI